MAEELSLGARRTILHAARTMFPHDDLPDEAYEKVVAKLAADGAADAGAQATLDEGAARLDADGVFADRDPDARLAALTAMEDSDFFRLLHATAVVELYDNPLVWRAFGYEGPSVHLGGYVDRGFDDLDWLPEPELVSAAKREMPSAATPETTQKFTTPPVNAPATA